MTETTPPDPIAPGAQLHPFRRALGWWFGVALWRRILGALVLGAIAGVAWGPGATSIAWIGELFVRLIRMLVVPLVFLTIAAGVAALADPKRLGPLGGRTVGLFALTTAIAVSVGMAVALLVEPGVAAPVGTAAPKALGDPVPLYDQLVGIIPLNIVEALAKGDMLALIFVGWIVVRCTLDPTLAPTFEHEPVGGWARWRPLVVYVTPLVMIFVVVILSMTAGWATPTESAAVGAAAQGIAALA